MARELSKYAKNNKIKFFLFNFTDLFGTQRAKLVPAEAADKMQKSGAGFAGFATWLDQTPAHPDLLVMPDPSSIIPLPWRPEVAWVAGDPWMEGRPLPQAPRLALKDMMAKSAEKNLKLMAGVEPEFHLPACYNVQPPPPGPTKAAAFSDETLFFMFYSSPRDALQEVAAQEL